MGEISGVYYTEKASAHPHCSLASSVHPSLMGGIEGTYEGWEGGRNGMQGGKRP